LSGRIRKTIPDKVTLLKISESWITFCSLQDNINIVKVKCNISDLSEIILGYNLTASLACAIPSWLNQTVKTAISRNCVAIITLLSSWYYTISTYWCTCAYTWSRSWTSETRLNLTIWWTSIWIKRVSIIASLSAYHNTITTSS